VFRRPRSHHVSAWLCQAFSSPLSARALRQSKSLSPSLVASPSDFNFCDTLGIALFVISTSCLPSKRRKPEIDANVTTREGIEEIDLTKVDHAMR